MLFDWLVIGQVMPTNPAHAVRVPKYSLKKGKTLALIREETRRLLEKIPIVRPEKDKEDLQPYVVGLRDRALIGLMVYSFVRIGAVPQVQVCDYYPNGKQWVKLHEKGGKFHEVFSHHSLVDYLHGYITAAAVAEEKKAPIFRTTEGISRKLMNNAMNRHDATCIVKRRARVAGVSEKIGCHTFRATSITTYLQNKGTLELAQKLACNESARTTGLYDWRDGEVSLNEIEKIMI